MNLPTGTYLPKYLSTYLRRQKWKGAKMGKNTEIFYFLPTYTGIYQPTEGKRTKIGKNTKILNDKILEIAGAWMI